MVLSCLSHVDVSAELSGRATQMETAGSSLIRGERIRRPRTTFGRVCTVVVNWQPDTGVPLRILAIRDELVSRPFDLPAYAWPDFPALFGGRDQKAGGSWCVSDVLTGTTAAVLNRIERRVGEPGAPSRGVLPLLAARHGAEWVHHVDNTGMASFNLLHAAPDSVTMWAFDGATLTTVPLEPGTHMLTVFGANPDGVDPRWERWMARLSAQSPDGALNLDATTDQLWAGWLEIVREAEPSDDPSALIVRHELEHDTFATVFGQLIAARPGDLRVDYSRRPWTTDEWITERSRQVA